MIVLGLYFMSSKISFSSLYSKNSILLDKNLIFSSGLIVVSFFLNASITLLFFSIIFFRDCML